MIGSNMSYLLDIIIIRCREAFREFSCCVNNVVFVTGNEERNNNLDLQFRNFHACAWMTA